MAIELTARQRSQLKACAHAIEPTVTIGQGGASDAVVREIERALTAHELIKVRAPAGDREERRRLLQDILEKTGAAAVQQVGRIFVLWRPAPEEGKGG
jgi:putative YhbY family RNA-binding protein